MSIADKLLYLNETKTVLADAINVVLSARGEAPLDANATFRSYAERLFYPGYLFGQVEQGGYYLPPNAGGYFADTAGTTPAALTDAIALVHGEVGPDWVQGTATARPLWAREPDGGRRNLLRGTEQLTASPWMLNGVDMSITVGNDGFFNVEDFGTTGDPFLLQTTVIVGDGSFYTGTIDVQKRESATAFAALFFPVLGGAQQVVNSVLMINVVTGAIKPFEGVLSSSVEDHGTFFRISATVQSAAGNNSVQFRFYPAYNNNWQSLTRDATQVGIVGIRKPQLEAGPVKTDYQRVKTALDVTEAGVPDVPYVRFDLADDVLTTTLPAATYTVALPTRQGIWIDSVEHAGGTFSVGPTSYTGGPEGILTALESDGVCKMIAPPLVIDRALTDAERSALVRWYQARGAGELLELLP